MATKRSTEILKDLPSEAGKVFRSKSKSAEWEHRPDSAGSGDCYVYYCDDCKRFHLEHCERGYRVTPGHVFDVRWSVDSDGDWSADEEDVDSPNYPRFEEDHSYESNRATWEGYFEYVAKTGDDHLGEFCVSKPKDKPVKWQARFQQSKNGVAVIGVKKYGDRKWISLGKAPSDVKDFLALEGNLVAPQSWKTIAEMKEAAHEVKWSLSRDGYTVGSFILTEKAPAKAADIKKAGRDALKKIRKEIRDSNGRRAS